jgi:3-oxoacyl-[acyl-carrier protein] reductase
MSTNSKKLAGKVAVITGASKGIGATIARLSPLKVRQSPSITLPAKLRGKSVKEITALGGKAIAVQANMSKQTEIDRLFAERKSLRQARHPGEQRRHL